MWSKNIHEAKRARTRHPYVIPKGVMLILVVISMVLLYAEEPHQEEIKAVIRPGHQEYSKIKTLTLEEHFPGDNQMMQIDFNENTVMYGTINSPELRSEEHFSEEEERELILLLEKYRFLEWVIVSDTYFEDKYGIMGEGKEGEPEYPSDRDDNYEIRVDLLNLNSEEEYIGMGPNECTYRMQDYDSVLLYETVERHIV